MKFLSIHTSYSFLLLILLSIFALLMYRKYSSNVKSKRIKNALIYENIKHLKPEVLSIEYDDISGELYYKVRLSGKMCFMTAPNDLKKRIDLNNLLSIQKQLS